MFKQMHLIVRLLNGRSSICTSKKITTTTIRNTSAAFHVCLHKVDIMATLGASAGVSPILFFRPIILLELFN